MQITKNFFRYHDIDAYAFAAKILNDKSMHHLNFIALLTKRKEYQLASWVMVRVMNYKQYTAHAIFAAERVIDIFEQQFPKDLRPRSAIMAARRMATKRLVRCASTINRLENIVKEANLAAWQPRVVPWHKIPPKQRQKAYAREQARHAARAAALACACTFNSKNIAVLVAGDAVRIASRLDFGREQLNILRHGFDLLIPKKEAFQP